jgi:hypothetical protein
VPWDHVYGCGTFPAVSEAAVYALWKRFGPQH